MTQENKNSDITFLGFILALGSLGLIISILGLSLLIVRDGKITFGEVFGSVVLLGFVLWAIWNGVIIPLSELKKKDKEQNDK